MYLRIDVNDGEVKRATSNQPTPRDSINIWISLAPHVKIQLSYPGASYVGAAMVAEAQLNGDLKFLCDEHPLRISDRELFRRKWPPGAWHFLTTLNAVEEWLTKELPGAYNPLFQNMIFRLIDATTAPAIR